MARPLNILVPTRYPWTFNGPRASRHHIHKRNFAPLNKISAKIEGITIFNPFPLQKFDLIHAFNRIPLERLPFIISYESHLPRAFGLEHSRYYRWMAETLAGTRCRSIVAISHYAKRQMLGQNRDFPWHDALAEKTIVRYPNLPVPAQAFQQSISLDNPIHIVFIGNHFGRKGGPVAVRIAEMARDENFPLKIDLGSALEYGASSWVDPLQTDFFEPYLKKLSTLPRHLHYHGVLPNKKVLSLLQNAHFSLLPTFGDTFGFSALESMAHGTPMIATTQCALPEVVNTENGILLPLEQNNDGEWKHAGRKDRDTPAYAQLFRDEIERLAHEAYHQIKNMAQQPERYAAMRQAAWKTIKSHFDADAANVFWDDYYEQVLNHDSTRT